MNVKRVVLTETKNDDIGEQKRLTLYRTQVVIREAEQRAYDLFLQNLVKGTSHLSLGQEAVAAGSPAGPPGARNTRARRTFRSASSATARPISAPSTKR
jgi:TPP-dependent pyruvate/acetoin dehydrogenase alpha subunit